MQKKSLIALLMVIAVVSSLLSGCGGSAEQTTEATQATETTQADKPNSQYADIDEDTPEGGVYKIWSPKGVANIAKYPDASFNLLCDVDMQGAEVTPCDFKGTINGNKHTIKNFTITATGENAGFFGKLSGNVKELTLDGYTLNITDAAVKYAGGLCGINEGSLTRCNVKNCTLNIADGLTCIAGSLAGYMEKGIVIGGSYGATPTIKAGVTFGGLVGEAKNADIEEASSKARIEFGKSAGATVGLLFGKATGTYNHILYKGEMNTMDGEFYTQLTGTGDAVFEKCYIRDNTNSSEFLSKDEQERRDTVINAMYNMAKVVWTPSDNLIYTCSDGMAYCSQMYAKGVTYYGLPYTHNNGSLRRFNYCFNEDGTFKDWLPRTGYDGYDLYMGNDCSGAIFEALCTISTSVRYIVTSDMIKDLGNNGLYPIGEYEWQSSADSYEIEKNTGVEKMYEAYARMHKGDILVEFWSTKDDAAAGTKAESRNHAHILAEDPCIIRDENGKIVPEDSTTTTHGQGESSSKVDAGLFTTWRTFAEETFAYSAGEETNETGGHRHYIPVSIKEYAEGTPKTELTFDDHGATGKSALYSGVIKSNYNILSATLIITDDDGNSAYEKEFFTGIYKYTEMNSNAKARQYFTEFNLSSYGVELSKIKLDAGKTYHAKWSTYLANGEEIELKAWDFQG